MNLSPRHRHLLAALLTVLCAQQTLAATVTVDVTTRPATAAADALIVFDPLDAAPAPSHDTAIIDQIGKQFMPRVSVVRTGTAITFPNSDHFRHQVYSFSSAKTFTLKLYAGSPHTAVIFDKAGLAILGCNIHDNMVGYVGVVDSPYFAKLNDSGSAALNLPPGRYRLRVWHPHAVTAAPPREIAVSTAPMNISLTIDLDSNSAAVAPWPE